MKNINDTHLGLIQTTDGSCSIFMWIERNWNFEIHEWQFSQFFIILSEKIAICGVISCEMARIAGIKGEWNFTILNWSETLFCEMLNIAFEHEFSVNLNQKTCPNFGLAHFFKINLQCKVTGNWRLFQNRKRTSKDC